jgi:hypothetical protein
MEFSIATFSRSLKAEIQKLQSTPLLWVTLGGGLFIPLFLTTIYLIKWERIIEPGTDPWPQFLMIGFDMVSMLLGPFLILTAAAICHPEHQGNTWKQLYTYPLHRANLFFSKLLTAIGLVLVAYLLYAVSIFPLGYFLDGVIPEFGFSNYAPPIASQLQWLGHSFLASLGMLTIQYVLSLHWRSFIPSIAIGLTALVVGWILLGRTELTHYYPYSFPALIQFISRPEVGIVGLDEVGGLWEVEWYSLGYLVSISLGYFWLTNDRTLSQRFGRWLPQA